MTYEEFRSVTRKLDDCLSAFLAIGKNLTRVKIAPIDFSHYQANLSQIEEYALQLRGQLFPHINQSEGNYAINTAITFIDCLIESNGKLTEICSNLQRKASGGSYGLFQYRRDLKDYESKENARELAGSQLNSAMRRPW